MASKCRAVWIGIKIKKNGENMREFDLLMRYGKKLW